MSICYVPDIIVRTFTFVNFFNPHNTNKDRSYTFISILHMRKKETERSIIQPMLKEISGNATFLGENNSTGFNP